MLSDNVVGSRRVAVVTAIAAAASIVPACRCEHDKPYVPYTIDTSPGATGSTPSAAPTLSAPPSASVDGGTFPRVPSQAAPRGATTWSLGGLSIAAPPGRIFLQGVAMQTPDKPSTVAAFVGDGGAMAGEVVLYRADATGKVIGPTTLARLPDWMPVGQGCNHVVSLAQIGPSTLWLDVVALCPKSDPKKPHRYLAAIGTSEGTPVRLELRSAELLANERLAIDADAADRDGDGQDDLLVQLTLEGAVAPLAGSARTTTSLKFVARPQGMSRDTQEPGHSLRLAASWHAAQASKKGAAEDALAGARQTERLYAIVCAEAGQPALTFGDGAPIPCGDPAIVEDAIFGELRAALSAGDLASAFVEGARFRAARPKSKRVTELDAALDAAAPSKKVRARPLRATPSASSVAIPLAFDPSGALLVLGDDGITKVDVATGDETAAPGAQRWSAQALLVSDLRFQGAADPCHGELVHALVHEGAGTRELPVGILGWAPPVCPQLPSPFLIDRDADGLTAVIGGVPVNVSADGERAQTAAWPSTPGANGTIRSPDGRWSALAAGDRVLLRGPDRAETWRPTPFFTLSACTAANDGKAVACTLEHGAVLLAP